MALRVSLAQTVTPADRSSADEPVAPPRISAVDLFCGAGGLTHGLEKVGIEVRLGVDLDPHCEYPYTQNNKAEFLPLSVSALTGEEIRTAFDLAPYRLLAGCAPCQPFSTYSQARTPSEDSRWNLLAEFGRLVSASGANIVTMENVPQLAKEKVFAEFTQALKDDGFFVSHQVVECVRYGVPQSRRRLVLLASRLGPIDLIEPDNSEAISVREAIGHLPQICAGGNIPDDILHASAVLSPKNLERIRVSKPGGTWRDWPVDLVAKCHSKQTGKTYPGVYGRMTWDAPAPTITTQYFGFGSGRFGHPQQDRALSLREGAILQSFPPDYKFVKAGKRVEMSTLGRLIGNAVPVKLGEAIGKSVLLHVQSHAA
ncbi:DNA cytosine methyltransferase [Methylobacterium bullatum]|uniref:DNA (cytosine-5-)-methyltransferase n=1 Tax=Methylobacterium bullatum TaxID=570505 RepID=A0A679JLW1_9HYPH|nr:putative BsuMI modification methylase subunit YdiO [Methylobacterium bullatum]